MFSAVYSVPRGFKAVPPNRTTSAARGTSAVITRSPAAIRDAMAWSATSNPLGTCNDVRYRDGGTR